MKLTEQNNKISILILLNLFTISQTRGDEDTNFFLNGTLKYFLPPNENIFLTTKEFLNDKLIPVSESGSPLPSLTSSLTGGYNGPLLMQDLNYQNHLAQFLQERIPERVVHAKGGGAYGYFEVTSPFAANFTKANLFSRVGQKTKVVVRLSTVVGEMGTPDSVNDLRGFAVKFYTEEGNYDLMMLNTKSFNLRDPTLFPAVTRSRKRNPKTHLLDNNAYWDFTSLRPETTFSTFLVFSDLGFPKNFRQMSGFAINTFKWTGGSNRESVFVRYSMISDGDEISDLPTYRKEAGEDPDSFIRDLYETIDSGKFPSWTLYVQIISWEQVGTVKFNPFDPTKIFPKKDFPLIPIGRMVLTQNAKNYFNEIEQVAFHPGNLVPGIELSPDIVLHGRIFAYSTAQRHRLGKDVAKIPVNCPMGLNGRNYRGVGYAEPYKSYKYNGPNYYPASSTNFEFEKAEEEYYLEKGLLKRFDRGEDDNYSQVANYWRDEMSSGERKRTVRAIAEHMSQASLKIQTQSLERNWDPINSEIGPLIRKELERINRSKESSNYDDFNY